jgi:hypothetical protein
VVVISQLTEDLSGLSLLEAKELASLLRQKWWPASNIQRNLNTAAIASPQKPQIGDF